jgi:membrane protease YdiL (CAAX protease family)
VNEINDPSHTIEAVIEPVALPPPRPTWPTWVEILLCSGYPTQILISYVLLIAGLGPMTATGQLNGTFVFLLALADTVLLLSLIVWLLRRRGERPLTVFFGDRPPAREIVVGMASLPLIIALVIALTLAIRRIRPTLHNVPNNPLEGLIGDHAGGIWLFLFVVIVAGGVREELQRAFLLHRFRDGLGQPWMGVIITSIAFGLGHTLQGRDAAVITGALGAAWGVMYLTRRSALASMVSHSLFNSGELLRAFLR